MKMVDEIRATLLDNATLFGFEYNGKSGNVDPMYTPETGNRFLLWYDGDEKVVDSIDAVMDTPFFDGHTLNEISDEITVTDW